MTEKQIQNISIGVILTLGFIMRMGGADFGLPYALHQDEPIVVNHAIAYGSGDFNPHFFIIPPLCSYLLFAFYGCYFVIGKFFSIFAGVDDFAMAFFHDASAFYLIGRFILGIIPGTLAIGLTAMLYRKLFGGKGASYAAAIMAFSFLPVINSHYSYTDSMLVCFILLVYISLLSIIRMPSVKNYVVSGIFLGLAVGVKYNAATLALTFFIAHVLAVLNNSFDKKRIFGDKNILYGALSSIAAFIVTNPFSMLDYGAFLHTVFGGIRNNYFGWTYHLTYSLAQGIGWGLLATGAIGAICVIVLKGVKKAVFIFSFPFAFYLHLVFSSQRFSRYGLPLVPFLAICAAFLFYEAVLPRIRTQRARQMVLLAAFVLVLPSLAKSLKADILFSGDDTRVSATEWLTGNIPEGTRIAVDHTSFRPQILQSREQLLEKRNIAEYQKGLGEEKSKKIDYLIESIEGKKTYSVYFLTHGDKKGGQFLSTVPTIAYDVDVLVGHGVEYVVINHNTFSGEKDDFIRELSRKADVVAEFSPYYDGKVRRPFDPIDATFSPISDKELFSRKMTGPCMVVYKLRDVGKAEERT